MHLHSAPLAGSVPVSFDTGLPSLPFKVTANGTIALTVAFDYELAFQFNANTQSTSFDTGALLNRFNPNNPAHELAVTVAASIPTLSPPAFSGSRNHRLHGGDA